LDAANELLDCKTSNLSSLRYWNVSGVSLTRKLFMKIKSRLPEVLISTSFGMTETNGAICAIAGEKVCSHANCVGRVPRTVEARIMDADGPVQTGNAGTIWLKGPMIMAGYLNSGGELYGLDNGWFCTGDAGYLSAQGELHLLERTSERVTLDGVVYSLSDIERKLLQHSLVRDACVVAVGPVGHDQKIGVAVVLEKIQDLAVSDVSEWLERRLDIPRRALVVFEAYNLPRTASGKVDRRAVRILASC